MLKAARLTAFAATADPGPARTFYRDTLGLPLRYEDEFALSFDANGIELRIQKVEKVHPHPYTTLGWNVTDIIATVESLASRGVTFERYPFMEQDAMGVWSAPGGAKVAWFKDPDGNLVSVAEYSAG